jgi:S1-C subfamily serine protease
VTKVAVEQGLRPYQDALKNAGFVVVELNAPSELRVGDTHAVVVSGMDENFMGVDARMALPVITAAGRTPLEVVNEVRQSLGPRE